MREGGVKALRRIGGAKLGVGQHDPQAKARRPAAVAHALAHIDGDHLADGSVGGDQALHNLAGGVGLLHLRRRDQGQPVAAGDLNQHGVEEIALHRVAEGQILFRDLDEDRLEMSVRGAADVLAHLRRALEGAFVIEEAGSGADAHHVVVEGAALDGGRGLPGEHGPGRAVAAGDGLRGLPRLAGRKLPRPALIGAAAIDQEIDPRLAVVGAQAHVICSALVRKVRLERQGIVHSKLRSVREQTPQAPGGLLVLEAPVQVGQQVRGREVHTPVGGVDGGGHGRGVGRPHGRGRRGGGGEMRRLVPGGLQHGRVVACKADAAQKVKIRPLGGRQHKLRQAKFCEAQHLGDPLLHRASWARGMATVARAGEVAGR